MRKAKKRQHSHVLFVQHQNSTEASNFEKLKDFIEHRRMSFFGDKARYSVLQTKQEASDDFFEISEYNRAIDFKFDQIKFKASMIGPTIGQEGNMYTQRFTETNIGKLPTFLKTGAGVPNQEKLTKYMNQSLSDQWWIKKKGRFALNATWVNSNLALKIPTNKAQAVVD
jgi:hypothetical protein